MENKLKKLFDYQRFERNERLEKLISETESRYAKNLSDEELAYVNAAGEPEKEQIGGIAGRNDNVTIDNCYNIGGMTGDFIGNYTDENNSKNGKE